MVLDALLSSDTIESTNIVAVDARANGHRGKAS
jgi:hypothetical protein